MVSHKLFVLLHSCLFSDILPIMAMSSDNAKLDPDYKFEIFQNPSGQICIHFSHAGQPTKSTVPLLMAMLLKAHIKAIKEETGEKPQSIGFQIFDNGHQFNSHLIYALICWSTDKYFAGVGTENIHDNVFGNYW